ncbi:MAG TPA: hypothetical protein VK427_27280 [Kofleriaceae bacterium]|nr:hypothetical protein [Kofleriaceae bacterium]
MNNGSGNKTNVMNEGGKLDHLKDNVKNLVDQGHEKVDQLKSKVMDVKDEAVTRGNVALDRATDFIRANPMKAVGIAFGVGYVGMRLFRR